MTKKRKTKKNLMTPQNATKTQKKSEQPPHLGTVIHDDTGFPFKVVFINQGRALLTPVADGPYGSGLLRGLVRYILEPGKPLKRI